MSAEETLFDQAMLVYESGDHQGASDFFARLLNSSSLSSDQQVFAHIYLVYAQIHQLQKKPHSVYQKSLEQISAELAEALEHLHHVNHIPGELSVSAQNYLRLAYLLLNIQVPDFLSDFSRIDSPFFLHWSNFLREKPETAHLSEISEEVLLDSQLFFSLGVGGYLKHLADVVGQKQNQILKLQYHKIIVQHALRLSQKAERDSTYALSDSLLPIYIQSILDHILPPQKTPRLYKASKDLSSELIKLDDRIQKIQAIETLVPDAASGASTSLEALKRLEVTLRNTDSLLRAAGKTQQERELTKKAVAQGLEVLNFLRDFEGEHQKMADKFVPMIQKELDSEGVQAAAYQKRYEQLIGVFKKTIPLLLASKLERIEYVEHYAGLQTAIKNTRDLLARGRSDDICELELEFFKKCLEAAQELEMGLIEILGRLQAEYGNELRDFQENESLSVTKKIIHTESFLKEKYQSNLKEKFQFLEDVIVYLPKKWVEETLAMMQGTQYFPIEALRSRNSEISRVYNQAIEKQENCGTLETLWRHLPQKENIDFSEITLEELREKINQTRKKVLAEKERQKERQVLAKAQASLKAVYEHYQALLGEEMPRTIVGEDEEIDDEQSFVPPSTLQEIEQEKSRLLNEIEILQEKKRQMAEAEARRLAEIEEQKRLEEEKQAFRNALFQKLQDLMREVGESFSQDAIAEARRLVGNSETSLEALQACIKTLEEPKLLIEEKKKAIELIDSISKVLESVLAESEQLRENLQTLMATASRNAQGKVLAQVSQVNLEIVAELAELTARNAAERHELREQEQQAAMAEIQHTIKGWSKAQKAIINSSLPTLDFSLLTFLSKLTKEDLKVLKNLVEKSLEFSRKHPGEIFSSDLVSETLIGNFLKQYIADPSFVEAIMQEEKWVLPKGFGFKKNKAVTCVENMLEGKVSGLQEGNLQNIQDIVEALKQVLKGNQVEYHYPPENIEIRTKILAIVNSAFEEAKKIQKFIELTDEIFRSQREKAAMIESELTHEISPIHHVSSAGSSSSATHARIKRALKESSSSTPTPSEEGGASESVTESVTSSQQQPSNPEGVAEAFAKLASHLRKAQPTSSSDNGKEVAVVRKKPRRPCKPSTSGIHAGSSGGSDPSVAVSPGEFFPTATTPK